MHITLHLELFELNIVVYGLYKKEIILLGFADTKTVNIFR